MNGLMITLLLVTTTVFVGCESEKKKSIETGDCIKPEDNRVPECNASFCYPERLDIQIQSSDSKLECTGYGDSESCEGNMDYQAFTYEDEQLYLYVSFDPEITNGYSQESIEQYFDYLWMNVYFPHEGNEEIHFQTDAIRAGDPQILSLTFDNGNLVGELDLGVVRDVYYEVSSNDDDCYVDDMLGECYCDYVIPESVPVTVKFSIPLEGK